MIAVVISPVIGRQARDMSILLTLAVCVLLCIAAVEFLEPVLELVRQLRRIAGLDNEAVAILLKAAGIGLLSELMGLICADAGESALGKAMQILSGAAIVWLSLPLFQRLLTMLEEVLAGI